MGLGQRIRIANPFRSPEYQSMETSGNQIILSFANVNGGWRPLHNELKGFTIAGEDQKSNATATLMKDGRIAVSAETISDPKSWVWMGQ